MHLKQSLNYAEVYESFSWKIPKYFNMGFEVCDKHANISPNKIALIVVSPDGSAINYSFYSLQRLSNKLVNMLIAYGLQPGNRFAILLPQSIEAAISHIAAWKMGAISIPLFTLFGEDIKRFSNPFQHFRRKSYPITNTQQNQRNA